MPRNEMNTSDRRFIQHIRTISVTLVTALAVLLLVYSAVTMVSVLRGKSITPVFANTVVFTANLRQGDSGQDVQELQRRFNEDSRTQVATAGPGSPGNETTYFGPLTHNAAIRYQELYRAEILTPVGLVNGTGFVGPSTRAHLNKTMQAAVSGNDADNADVKPSIVTETNGGADPDNSIATDIYSGLQPEAQEVTNPFASEFKDYNTLVVVQQSLYDGPRGTTLTIAGSGFTREDNTVHLGESYTIKNVPSSTGTSITFIIPQDAPYGKHALYVSNTKGISHKYLFFVVTREGAPRPVVTSATPSEGFYGEEVTIYGSGFTPTGNEVRASHAIITDLESSDGTTLTLQVLPPIDAAALGLEVGKDSGQGLEFPIWFFVVNDNGVASGHAEFTLKI